MGRQRDVQTLALSGTGLQVLRLDGGVDCIEFHGAVGDTVRLELSDATGSVLTSLGGVFTGKAVPCVPGTSPYQRNTCNL